MPRGRRGEGGAAGVRRRALVAVGLALGVLAAGPAVAATFDPGRLSEARDVRLERIERDARTARFLPVASAKANARWLNRLGLVALRDARRLPDSSCAVACGRCPDRLQVDVTFVLAGQPYRLTLHMREGLAFLRATPSRTKVEGPDAWSLRATPSRSTFSRPIAWSFADLSTSVAGLLREVRGGKLLGPWQPPAVHPEPPSPDSAAYHGDDFIVSGLPEAIEQVMPEYPRLAQNLGVERVVYVRALVAADGSVVDTRVAELAPGVDETAFSGGQGLSTVHHVVTPQRQLGQAAVDAVRRWRFKPATCGGRSVALWVAVPVRFRLQ